MTHAGYVLSGWGIVLGSLGIYAFRTVLRGRQLAKLVPPERHRWLDTDIAGAGGRADPPASSGPAR